VDWKRAVTLFFRITVHISFKYQLYVVLLYQMAH